MVLAKATPRTNPTSTAAASAHPSRTSARRTMTPTSINTKLSTTTRATPARATAAIASRSVPRVHRRDASGPDGPVSSRLTARPSTRKSASRHVLPAYARCPNDSLRPPVSGAGILGRLWRAAWAPTRRLP
ncbi:MAG: hypothetical protein AVDCRST_MAG49-3646 [uncultured Thermomicrobiales bacterium]|uniref:Uncharacterized protein n=1 Tax=uncultured Thermomicrobiales bacterium TaxID=1645740 RepID=A0A6J4V9T8_9BACT|nr:MAG: hypothetical protein AVDCRST_MAG49-3646 [uncultured Thermomicrobiales bacterium]